MHDTPEDHSHDPVEDFGPEGVQREPRPRGGATPPMVPVELGAPQRLPTERNALAVASLVLGVLGFLCLPLVGSIAGLVCGIMGARREPRGLAIAGIVVSSLGVLAGCLIVPMMVGLLLPALAKGRQVARELQTTVAATEVLIAIEEADGADETDDGPESLEELFLAAPAPVDSWGTPLRLERRAVAVGEISDWDATKRIYLIWSAGPDAAWDTDDDFVAACHPVDAAARLGLPEID